MDYRAARNYLNTKPEAIEDHPFGPDILVMKVRGRMYATLVEVEKQCAMNLKCDPDQALALRDIFPAVVPGYHMNKKHWNTVYLDGSIPPGEIERMIDHSYTLVVKKLPRAERLSLELAHGRDILYQ